MFARIELPAAFILAFAAPMIPSWLPYLVGVQIFLHIIAALTTHRSREQQRFDLLLGLLALIIVVNLAVAPFPLSVDPALRLLSSIGLFRVVLGTSQSPSAMQSYTTILGILSLVSAGAWVGSFVQPVLSEYAAAQLFVPLSMAVVCSAKSNGPALHLRILHGAAVCISISAVALSPHANALPALLFGAMLSTATSVRPSFTSRMPAVLLAISVALILLPALPYTWTNLLFTGSTMQAITTVHERWTRAFDLIQSFPFTGVGFGAFSPAVGALYPLTTVQAVNDAGNLALQITAEIGIPGALTIIMLFAHAVNNIIARPLAASDSSRSWIAVGALTALATILAAGLTNAPIWSMSRFMPALWFVVAAAVKLTPTRS